MDRKKIYIISGVITGLVVTYFILESRKRKRLLYGANELQNEDKSIIPQGTQPVKYSDIFPLKLGSGYESYTVKTMVKNVQRFINRVNIQSGIPLLEIDGLFGAKTEKQLYAITRKRTVNKEDYQTMID